MIPKLHKKGTSFRGAALYLLHDKGADTAERVVWTETRNLATKNPEAAWRVMSATALDQGRLKSEAGIKSTGRKSKESVLHLTLSWHPDETEGLTTQEMVAAADGALSALKAEGHQALYVIHDDEPQCHIHVLCNRISPLDGRMLSSSKEKIALSRWAESYEKARGTIYCEERVLNNAARDRGNYIRGRKDVPRHIFELQAGNDNESWAVRLREDQQAKDLEVRRKQIAQKQRHAGEWRTLHAEHKAGKTELGQRFRRETTIAKQRAGEAFLDDYARLAVEQETARRAFLEREESLFGKGLNMLRSIDWTGLLRQERRSVAIKEAFGLLAGRIGSRSEALRRQQQRETLEIERREAEAKRAAAEAEKEEHRARMQEHQQAFLVKRQDILFRHQMEDSWIATLWQERRTQRSQTWEQARKMEATRAFEQSAMPEEVRQREAEKFMGRMRLAHAEHERSGTKKRSLKERAQDRERDRDRER